MQTRTGHASGSLPACAAEALISPTGHHHLLRTASPKPSISICIILAAWVTNSLYRMSPSMVTQCSLENEIRPGGYRVQWTHSTWLCNRALVVPVCPSSVFPGNEVVPVDRDGNVQGISVLRSMLPYLTEYSAVQLTVGIGSSPDLPQSSSVPGHAGREGRPDCVGICGLPRTPMKPLARPSDSCVLHAVVISRDRIVAVS